jgi:hypothetical protein
MQKSRQIHISRILATVLFKLHLSQGSRTENALMEHPRGAIKKAVTGMVQWWLANESMKHRVQHTVYMYQDKRYSVVTASCTGSSI